ncbi:hypothetical protein LXA43DRAFT_1110117 [Ganoderma leucocontextum]|nr:hypothetical protein LXA43DRAFT_1110117 [Ganoderma leucocontextum]
MISLTATTVHDVLDPQRCTYPPLARSVTQAPDSWAERIRTLYHIAVSTFVFPILFNIAEIFVIFYDPNFFHGATVVTVNCYVTIIGVLFATIWAQGSKSGKLGCGSRIHATTVLGSVEFAPQQAASNAESDMPDDDEDDRPSRSKQGQAPPSRSRMTDEARRGRHQASTTIGSNSPVLCCPWFFKLGSVEPLKSSVGLFALPPRCTPHHPPVVLDAYSIHRDPSNISPSPNVFFEGEPERYPMLRLLLLLNANMCKPTRCFTRALPTIIHLTVINMATFNFLLLFPNEHAEPAEGESRSMLS